MPSHCSAPSVGVLSGVYPAGLRIGEGSAPGRLLSDGCPCGITLYRGEAPRGLVPRNGHNLGRLLPALRAAHSQRDILERHRQADQARQGLGFAGCCRNSTAEKNGAHTGPRR